MGFSDSAHTLSLVIHPFCLWREANPKAESGFGFSRLRLFLSLALLALATTLCHAVSIPPQTTGLCLLSGPADQEDVNSSALPESPNLEPNFMKPIITPLTIAVALFALALPAVAGPPLVSFATIKPDPVGKRLESSMIWNHAEAEKVTGVAVAFRKKIHLAKPPAKAALHLFADARYILWVNGQYVDRGPARFQPNGPEYDSVDLSSMLKAGENVIALLVAGNLSGGKVMRHAPGLTALVETDGKEAARTDSSWKWSVKTKYRKVTATWANLGDAEIDARAEDGDWTQPDYVDAAWQPAVSISSAGWGSLTARRIPMLRETPVPCTFTGDATLPVTLQAGQKLEFNAGRIVQAYPLIELTAEAGTELKLLPFKVKYVAKDGPQSHFTIDTCGVMKGSIIVEKGSATITGFKLIERLYPFERLGRFQSNDAMLNRLWEICARSCEVLSEDAYVDCADRERVEWMDCDPPAFDVTRTAMAGPAGLRWQAGVQRSASAGRNGPSHGPDASARWLGEGPHLFRSL